MSVNRIAAYYATPETSDHVETEDGIPVVLSDNATWYFPRVTARPSDEPDRHHLYVDGKRCIEMEDALIDLTTRCPADEPRDPKVWRLHVGMLSAALLRTRYNVTPLQAAMLTGIVIKGEKLQCVQHATFQALAHARDHHGDEPSYQCPTFH